VERKDSFTCLAEYLWCGDIVFEYCYGERLPDELPVAFDPIEWEKQKNWSLAEGATIHVEMDDKSTAVPTSQVDGFVGNTRDGAWYLAAGRGKGGFVRVRDVVKPPPESEAGSGAIPVTR